MPIQPKPGPVPPWGIGKRAASRLCVSPTARVTATDVRVLPGLQHEGTESPESCVGSGLVG